MSQQETIRAARQRLNMSQATLADAAGLSERTVKRAESGHGLSPETAQALSSVLELPPGTLRSGPAEFVSVPLLETTLPEDALAKDPRMAEIQAMLMPGSPFEAVVVPDPRPYRERPRRAGPVERLTNWLLALSGTAALVAVLLLLIALALPQAVGSAPFVIILCAVPLMACSAILIHVLGSPRLRWEVAESFASEAIVAVERDLLHVIRIDPVSVSRRTFKTGPGVSWSVMREDGFARHMLSVDGQRVDIHAVPARSSLDRLAMGGYPAAQPEASPPAVPAAA